MRILVPLLLLTSVSFGQPAIPQSAREAYSSVQASRGEARNLFERGDKDSIERAIRMLDETLNYLEQPLVRDLTRGDMGLVSCRVNILIDLAEAYAREGNDRESLARLRLLLQLAPEPKIAQYLDSTPTFSRLHDNADFESILREFQEFQYFWDSRALATPYRENIPDAEKLAGLAKLWSEVKYNFGFPEKLLAVAWDKLYLESIPKVLATKSTADYYRELQALCARLRDGHTTVILPPQVRLWIPPLSSRLVEGRVMVLDVNSPSLEQQGVKPGMEIVEIEGEAPRIYAKRELEPYLSASTPQDLDNQTFSMALLRGSAQQPVRLKLRTPSGELVEKTIARSGYTDVRRPPGFEWRWLENRIAYVSVNRFDQEQVVNQFRDAFPHIADSAALILDLRRNGGGNSNNALAILQFLLLKPTLGQRQVMRSYNPTLRAQAGVTIGTTEAPGFPIRPRAGDVYRNPVVVLTSAATYSAAEDFMVAWQTSGRGKTIGEPTGGSTGQPVTIQLPGGGSARICSKRDTFPDGSVWEGVGIQPDILARPTVSDVVAGRDTVLERALEYLTSLNAAAFSRAH